MSAVKILIVENEVIISEEIALKLQKEGYVVTAQVANAKDAIQSVNDRQPDLIIMDIDLDGKPDGIDTAIQIKKQFSIPVIFLTDLDNKKTMARASKAKPANYLIKPFSERQINVSIHQALYNVSESKIAIPGDPEIPTEDHYILNDCLFIRIDNKHFKKIFLKDILYIEADGAYANIHTTTGEKHTYSISMNHVHDKIKHPSFMRVSRSFVVNLERITDIKGNLLVVDKKEISIGASFREDVIRCLPMLR
jgi:DNA-binding LytR/AlgR family response regulator